MRIAIAGSTGQIGSKVAALLGAAGHDIIGISRGGGCDVVTGEGLDAALSGADVFVDVTNAPSFDDDPVMAFFTAESANLVAAARDAGIGHFVVLSIVGADGLPDSGYMRAKIVQETTIVESGLPYTIVRATQFHEFADMIVGSLLRDGAVHVPDARIQPIAAAEVAAEVADIAQEAPINGIVNLGGPEKMSFAQLATTLTSARGQSTPVVIDADATYFGTPVGHDSLVTGLGAAIADTTLKTWLATS